VTGSSTLRSPEPRSTGAPHKFVFDFSEGGKDQKDLLGGKGANLAEMVRLGLPVPPGFTISTEACRAYLAAGTVPVNSVAPGYVSTEMVQAVPKEALDKVVAKIPVGRLGEPDEIARVVEFLADPDSGFITGQLYSVNGGQYM
jgi:phosphoenolpyruvate synthase/pyruvate phosphate dikinase